MARLVIYVAVFVAVGSPLTSSSPAQITAGPQFEVVSVRPSVLSDIPRTPMEVDPARVSYVRLSPKILIQIAYKLPEWALSGGPKWLDSDRYDIIATLPPSSSPDQIPLMLQTVLAERFHLKLRRETRQMSVYELTVAKNGPKLKAGDTSEQWRNGTMRGGIFRGRIELHQMTLAGLADFLSSKTGRAVIDRTHLAGAFDIRLKWRPDDTSGDGVDADSPSLYSALGEQLGLKLEPARAPVEVFVVSRIEKPSEN